MDTHDFRAHAKLDVELLAAWIEAGWLTPATQAGLPYFSEVDLAEPCSSKTCRMVSRSMTKTSASSSILSTSCTGSGTPSTVSFPRYRRT